MEASSTTGSTTEIVYTQLDKVSQLANVRARIRDLEVQHQQISLRINMPAPNDMVSGQDRANLEKLTDSLQKLYDLEKSLSD